MAAINRVQYHPPPPLSFCEGPRILQIKRRRRPNRRIASLYSILFVVRVRIVHCKIKPQVFIERHLFSNVSFQIYFCENINLCNGDVKSYIYTRIYSEELHINLQ